MKDKVAIITGASSGIGKALCYELAQHGASVVLAARNFSELQLIALDIKERFDVECLAIATDVSIEADCEKLINEAVDKFGKIDILINNAGVSQRVLFQDLDLNVIRRIMDVNYWGSVYCTKFALNHILKTKGSIVAISSISGYSPLPGRTGYCSSKYALHGFIETLRIELLKTGVHVLLATPGFTTSNIRVNALVGDNKQQGESPRDESKMMSSEEVAIIVRKGIEKRKRTLIISFHGKIIFLLTKLLPKFTDHLIYKLMSKESNSPLK